MSLFSAVRAKALYGFAFLITVCFYCLREDLNVFPVAYYFQLFAGKTISRRSQIEMNILMLMADEIDGRAIKGDDEKRCR